MAHVTGCWLSTSCLTTNDRPLPYGGVEKSPDLMQSDLLVLHFGWGLIRGIDVTVKRYLAGMAAISVFAALSSCAGDDPPPPSRETTAATPTPTDDAWRSGYTEEEQDFFDEALSRARSYEAKTQPIWAEGRVTDEARKLFEDNLITPATDIAQLESFEAQGIQIARRPEELSASPQTLKLYEESGGETTIKRCVDATDLGGTQNGEPLEQAATGAVLQTVLVIQYEDGTWRFGEFHTTEEPCEP